MRISSNTYAAAADRLERLINTIPGNPRIRIDGGTTPLTYVANDWELQLRGAAKALAHHEEAIDQRSGWIHENDHGPCILIADDLNQATGAIYEYLDAIESPAPHIRERALDDLRGCAATLRCLPA